MRLKICYMVIVFIALVAVLFINNRLNGYHRLTMYLKYSAVKVDKTTKHRQIKLEKDPHDVLIVGAGLSGAVLAHLHAKLLNETVLIVEKREHIAGNCYDYINKLGIRVSKYGAHLFHTNDPLVWRFVSQFGNWRPYQHRVIGLVDGKQVPIPVNIQTVNSLLGENIVDTKGMQEWLEKNQIHNKSPKNGEEAALARVGQVLYEKIFKAYTLKQWDKSPADLDASILQRIPVCDNFDDRYFPSDLYQALPANGYTRMIRRMLSDPKIDIKTNSDFFKLKFSGDLNPDDFSRIYFTGPIDHYFSESRLERLEYRSIKFETIHLTNQPFYQSNSVVNYPQLPDKFTRVVEYKHFYAQDTPNGTTIVREYSTDSGDPYYPVLNERNRNLYGKYRELAENEEKGGKKLHFVGRLASFRYFNMDQAILNAIQEFKRIQGKEGRVFKDAELFGDVDLASALSVFQKKKDTPSLSIVVSRCTESADWLSEYEYLCEEIDVNIYVYHKCGGMEATNNITANIKCNVHNIPMDNNGREGHSWLHHMLYKSFDFRDVNVFLQGRPHIHNKQDVLRATEDIVKAVDSFKVEDFLDTPKESLDKHFKSKAPFLCPMYGLSPANHAKPYCMWFEKLTGTRNDCLKKGCYLFGEFLVTEVLIRRTLSMHRDWMEEMYTVLGKENNPIEGQFLERLWTIIFLWPKPIDARITTDCSVNIFD